jgi:phage terminase large subunit-like protein
MTAGEYRARLRARRCFLGLDLSSTKDLTALVGVFPDGNAFDVLAAFFVPADTIRERSTRDRVPYDEWARRGFLTATPGNSVDYEYVRETVRAWGREFHVITVAVDPWNARMLITQLSEADGFDCVEMRQGYASLSAPTKALEKAILSRTLRHDGNPVLRWNVQNVSVETDAAGNLKVSKKVSTERIDGVAALVMAMDQLDRHAASKPAELSVTVYGRRRM